MVTTAERRRNTILDELKQKQAVSVTDLTKRFGVSEVSIRRDLSRLERTGQLRRIHGGALVAAEAAPEVLVDPVPQGENDPVKARIGQAAARLVKPGDRLIFDSGTTVLEIARCLRHQIPEGANLTAITNSVPIVHELGPHRGVHLILLGGIYLQQYRAVVGPSTVAQLSALHADKMFLGADGLTLSHGLTNANVLEAEVDRVAVRAASRIIAVADSSKIGRVGLTPIVPLAGIHTLITDTGAPDEFVEQLRALGVEVLLV